jgi:hypothetical protein
MAYRRFRLSENKSRLATLATLATVQTRSARTVANVASVARQSVENRARQPQTVATVATVAGQNAENDARLAEGVENSTPLRASPFKVENSTLKPGSDPADWQAYFDERAGIREFDGEMPRDNAEAVALQDTIAVLGPPPLNNKRGL